MTARRVLHVVKYFPPDAGGMESFAHDLCQEQARRGHTVLVLALAGQAAAGTRQLAPTLTVKRSPVLWRAAGGYAPVSPGLCLNIMKARIFRPEIIHLHCPNPVAPFMAMLAGRTPLIIQWQADVVFPPESAPPAWQLKLWRRLERAVLKKAGFIIAGSPDYARASEALRPFQDKCRVAPLCLGDQIPPAVYGRAGRWLAEKPAGTRVLFIGRLAAYKGLDVLLEAAARLGNVNLCLIGEGEEHGRLARRVARPDLTGRVFLAGFVPEGDREAALNEADILCLPSLDRRESFGLVLLEAMRKGLACVASRVQGSGMCFAVKDGETGLLARPGDAAALAAAIKTLLDDPELRRAMGQAGRRRFSEFTLKKMTDTIDDIYNTALA